VPPDDTPDNMLDDATGKAVGEALADALQPPLLALLHHHADLDCVGSAIGLARSLPDVTISASDGLNQSGRLLAERLGVEILAAPPDNWEGTVVALDTPRPDHCAPLPSAPRYIVIDHHQHPGGWPKGALLYHDPEAAATGELILRLLTALDRPLCAAAALPLLVAVIADTGQFRHARGGSFEAAFRLCRAGADPREAFALMEREMHASQRIAMLKAAQRVKWTQEGKWLVATSRIGAFESGAARALTLMGADVGLVVAKRGTQVRLSSRASQRVTVAGFSLAAVLNTLGRELGGSAGGHPGAAGYSGHGDAEALLEMARQACVQRLHELT